MRKQRVETYLDPETVEEVAELARKRDCSSSEVIREATRREIQRSMIGDSE